MINEEYILKQKYRNLYYSLTNIKRSMANMKSTVNGIKTLASNTVKINKKGIEEDSFNKLSSLNDNISNSLSSAINSTSHRM